MGTALQNVYNPNKTLDAYGRGGGLPDEWGETPSALASRQADIEAFKAAQTQATAQQAGVSPTQKLQTVYEDQQPQPQINMTRELYNQLLNNDTPGPERYDPNITGRNVADNMSGYQALMQRPNRGIDFLAFARGGEMAEDVGWKHYNRNRIRAQQRQQGITAMSKNAARDMMIKFNTAVLNDVNNNKMSLADAFTKNRRDLLNGKEYLLSNPEIQNYAQQFMQMGINNIMAQLENSKQFESQKLFALANGIPYNSYASIPEGNISSLAKYINENRDGGGASVKNGMLYIDGRPVDHRRVYLMLQETKGDLNKALAAVSGEQATYELGEQRADQQYTKQLQRRDQETQRAFTAEQKRYIFMVQQAEATGKVPKGATQRLIEMLNGKAAAAGAAEGKPPEAATLDDAEPPPTGTATAGAAGAATAGAVGATAANANTAIANANAAVANANGKPAANLTQEQKNAQISATNNAVNDDKDKENWPTSDSTTSLDYTVEEQLEQSGETERLKKAIENGSLKAMPTEADVSVLTPENINKIVSSFPDGDKAKYAYKCLIDADGDVAAARKAFYAKYPNGSFFKYWVNGLNVKGSKAMTKREKQAQREKENRDAAKGAVKFIN